MTITKYCHKNSNCQLWQMLCDGSPCLVEKEIELDSNSNSILSPRSNRIWNSSGFKSGELIDLAVKIEKTGNQLYKRLAKKTSNEELKNLLLYLAADEKRHMLKLRDLSKRMTIGTSEAALGEYFEFVRTTVETHIFNGTDKIERLAENARSVKDIVKLASDFEKDTIIFFNGFRNLILDKQEVVDELIKEQQTHLIKLTRLRKDAMAEDGKPMLRPKRYPKRQTATEIA